MTSPVIHNGQVKTGRERAQQLHEQLGTHLYERAYNEGLNLSAWLEREDPSEAGDTLDAFGRQMQAAGIRVRAAGGVAADRLEKFGENPRARALLPEWLARQYRRVSAPEVFNYPTTRTIQQSSDYGVGSLMRPYVDSAIDRSKKLAPAIPLSAVVATTTAIEGDSYRTLYTNDVPAQQRYVRVGETAQIPRTSLTQGTREVQLYKFGRGIEISYEALRRQRIDRVALIIARMAVQAEVDKVAAIIDVLVNGDGNANTAATNVLAKTDLDSVATGKSLTLKAWLLYKMMFQNPYMLTTVLARTGDAFKMLSLNLGSANVPLVSIAAASGFGGFQQINPGLADNVALGWTDDAPADVIVGFDARFAIERVTETAAALTEVTRWVDKQTEALFMSEVEGYAKQDPQAVKTLTLET